MAKLSIGEALSDGFGLIGRRPLDCLVWGLAYFVLAFLPAMAICAWVVPDWLAFMRDAVAHPDAASPADFGKNLAMQMKFQSLQPLILLATLVGRTVVYCAVFRAIIRPQERGFFHLQLGATELWVGLVILVQYVCAWLVMIALILVGMVFWVPTFISAAHQSLVGWEPVVGIVGLFGAMAVMVWLCVRFSMAAPMTFAERQFRLFESWRLTRGRALSLFLLYFVMVLIMIALVIVIEIVVAVAFVSVVGMNLGQVDVESWLRQPADQIIASAAPFVIGIGLVWALISGFITAVVVGCWASAYRQIAPKPI